MAEPKIGIFNFVGFQSEVRSTSALQVRIAYRPPRFEHLIRSQGDDWLLSFDLRKGRSNSGQTREGKNLDPYAICKEFEAIDLDRPEVVARFLDEAGRFWRWETVRLSQIAEWRDFFRWLRMEPDEAKKTPEGEKAWNTASLARNSFFSVSDLEFTRGRFPPGALSKMERSESWKDLVQDDHEKLSALRRFALYPASPNFGNQVRLHWYDPSDWLPQQRGATRKLGRAP